MLYRRYGKTEERVSVLGLGAMRLPLLPGGASWQIDEGRSIALIRQAIDGGVNYVDTAYGYHPAQEGSAGLSEPLVGRALGDGYREKTFLATKLPVWLVESREDMDRLLNEQLERLATDHIDFYLAHALSGERWEKLRDLGIREFFDAAKADGRIRHAGFSFHDNYDAFDRILHDYGWEFCQIQYNYLDEDYQAGRRGTELAASMDMGLAIMEPLRGGKLSTLPDAASQDMVRLHPDWSPSAWGLRWVWNHPQVSIALSGMSNAAQLTENLATADAALAGSMKEDELAAVATAKAYIESRKQVPCTACEYCMPCPAGVDIPGCFANYNSHFMFGQDAFPPYSALQKNEAQASRCVSCGQCLPKCPQSIPIPDRLLDVRKCFEAV